MADKTIILSKDPSQLCQEIPLIEGDNNTYVIRFVAPRYSGGVDLANLTWGVNIKNATLEQGFVNLSSATSDDSAVYIDWNVGSFATVLHGSSFCTIEGRNNSNSAHPVWKSSVVTLRVGRAISADDIIDGSDIDSITEIAENVAESIVNNSVRYDTSQSLNSTQKTTARTNIGAVSQDEVDQAIAVEATAREAADDELKVYLSDVDLSVNKYVNLTWEQGGINLNTGDTTADGSTTRSRVVEYLDTKNIVEVINKSNATLWLCFYSFSNGTYAFVNAINVDAGNSWKTATNHARYLRLDFRSSLEDAEKVRLLASNVQYQIDNIDMTKAVQRIGNIDDIVPVSLNDFFNGNISLSGTAVAYTNYANRTATRQGVTYPLKKGDLIYLSDYTNARFYVYWNVNGNWYSNNGWITTGIYAVTVTGNYAILLSNKTEAPQTSVVDLANLLIIKKNDLKPYVSELVEEIKCGLKPYNPSSNAYLTEKKPLVLFHFSDIHGDVIETDRINDVYQKVVDVCDDVICTGDMCESRFSDDASFITDKGFLLCIGNHDALSDPTGWDWTQMATQQQLYNKFLANIASWGATYTQNITYYYKDYTSKGIRLIVLNNSVSTEDMEVQLEWLTNILNDAITNNLSVIIAMHYHPSNAQKIDSNFTRLDKELFPQSSGGAIPYRVQQFIQGGGQFICYLVGHEHSDYILNSSDYPNQIAICIDASSVSQSNIYSELDRRYGDQSQDLYNVCVFDTSTKTIKIVRVGCDIDNYLRSRKSMCIRYDTGEIVSQE